MFYTVCKEDLGSETEQSVNQKYKSEENKLHTITFLNKIEMFET